MGNLLDAPRTEKLHTECIVTSSGLDVGSAGIQGWRVEMEDSHIIADIPSCPSHTLLAIFDGHGGAGAAIYAAANLVKILEASSKWNEYVQNGAEDVEVLGEALSQTFIEVDVQLRKKQDESRGDDTSGCTAVCAVVTPNYIVCSNAGDSRCVLGTNNQTINMSEDHKPYDEGERRRIENAGGTVQWKRVDGDLAVSRALGDFQYKTRYDLGPKEQKVTCWPDITVHRRTPNDDVLILACDGVWDVMTSAEAVGVAREIFMSGETNLQLVSEELVDMTLNKGSRDNISAVIMKLPGATLGDMSVGGVRQRRANRDKGASEADDKKRAEFKRGDI
mmetsp:Transcript_27472/g.27696  ORF Transcript_27472/g.27696 Transcript_27472/m.27696 type:complete len:334 (+) Transcript_27472:81-1082(+)|eukprot:CAMPEP_0182417976 /NCGR_PEP_ID=MMETSP1167-20130531/2433_1 /TAXON_ID=2988 /ORGANISM="Mallomonas Sp, Strain CCMP3275" /LENGTH=333 /DNA_ID=CAMNT_0024591899 /DNA_START=81 /DNA_END=1082 /DNA_ORIENTATION=+